MRDSGRSEAGTAPAMGAGDPGFDSPRPDQISAWAEALHERLRNPELRQQKRFYRRPYRRRCKSLCLLCFAANRAPRSRY